MDTSFPLTQTRCYQQAARLMAKGASLSVALRGCMGARGSRTSTATRPAGNQSSAEDTSDST
jgi:hypothetical protein